MDLAFQFPERFGPRLRVGGCLLEGRHYGGVVLGKLGRIRGVDRHLLFSTHPVVVLVQHPGSTAGDGDGQRGIADVAAAKLPQCGDHR